MEYLAASKGYLPDLIFAINFSGEWGSARKNNKTTGNKEYHLGRMLSPDLESDVKFPFNFYSAGGTATAAGFSFKDSNSINEFMTAGNHQRF